MKFTAPKYGFKEFKRNIFFNLYIIAQLTAVLILMVYSISSIAYVSKFYNPLKYYLEGNGFCTWGLNYNVTDELKKLNYIDSVFWFNELPLDEVKGYTPEEVIPDPTNSNVPFIYSYDDDFINDYKPLLEKGKWLDEYDTETDGCINAVVSYNEKYKIGDICTVVNKPNEDETIEIKLRIVGMLSDGAKVLDKFGASSEISDATSLYKNYYSKQHPNGLLFLTKKSEKTECRPGMLIVKFKDGYSKDELDKIYADIGNKFEDDVSIMWNLKTERIGKKSLKSINEQKIMMMPLIVGIVILIIVSIFSMSAISSNKQLKNYGIYTVSGATRKRCIFIQMWNVFYSCVLSVVLAYVVFKLMTVGGIISASIVSIGRNELLACGAIIVIAIIASAVMPAIIIGRAQAKEMLKEEE